MSGLKDLMDKINSDEEIIAEITRAANSYSGDDRNKLVKDIAKRYGVKITDEEIEELYSERELTDGELSMVAGGTGTPQKNPLLFSSF